MLGFDFFLREKLKSMLRLLQSLLQELGNSNTVNTIINGEADQSTWLVDIGTSENKRTVEWVDGTGTYNQESGTIKITVESNWGNFIADAPAPKTATSFINVTYPSLSIDKIDQLVLLQILAKHIISKSQSLTLVQLLSIRMYVAIRTEKRQIQQQTQETGKLVLANQRRYQLHGGITPMKRQH